MEITGTLSKAARTLLGWKSADLAEKSGLSHDTIRAFESGRTKRLIAMNEKALVEAFSVAGVVFIPENGGGVGVRFEKPSK